MLTLPRKHKTLGTKPRLSMRVTRYKTRRNAPAERLSEVRRVSVNGVIGLRCEISKDGETALEK